MSLLLGFVPGTARDAVPHVECGPAGTTALSALLEGCAPRHLDEIVGAAPVADGAIFYSLLAEWGRLGLLELRVCAGAHTLASMAAVDAMDCLLETSAATQPCRLSRFAYARGDAGCLRLYSAARDTAVTLEASLGGKVLGTLGEPMSAAEVAGALGLDAQVARELFVVLVHAGVLVQADEAAAELPHWGLHDLLFHRTVARARNAATFPQLGHLPPAPVTRSPHAGPTVELPAPRDWRNAPTFAEVIATRRSIRRHGTTPLSADQLSDFLHRCARVKQLMPGGTDDAYIVSRRPYPSAGACFPLEIYVGALACAGLERGLYHYDPQAHRLTRLPPLPDDVERLGHSAGAMTGQPMRPQVVLVLTARIARTAWKYGEVSYSLVLRDLGVLQQTLHLTAAAMQLAGCILGAPPPSFARISGIAAADEPALGQFLLGTQP